VKEILDYGDEVKLNWKDYKVNIVTGGEGFSEGWRNYIRDRINGSYGEVFSAYGASDIDIGVGFETDFTIKIKQLADKDKEFNELIFGKYTPTFFGVYNPLVYHIEQYNDELLFSAINPDIWVPKLRYNLKDAGRIYKYNELKNIIDRTKYKSIIKFANTLHLPFITIYGRSDGTISLDGANIYPYDIQDAIYRSKSAKYFNSFFIDTEYTKDKSMYFNVSIELTENKKVEEFNNEDIKEIQDQVRETLLQKNKDYKESWTNNPESLEPKIKLINFAQGIFIQNSNKLKKVYMIKR
jgi:phenylacetate-CoA ligase